ncbi:MAG TPA: DUF1294 domain-containing protein [Clostridiales bacterium]|nr:DUF1294 domain-containing protein [Clostridiales bacterium]
MSWPFIIYLVLINVITALVFFWDKKKAENHQWRIPEWVLFTLSWIGGAVGAYIAMRVFHHKTRKKNFAYGIPAIFGCHVMAFLAVLILALSGQATM